MVRRIYDCHQIRNWYLLLNFDYWASKALMSFERSVGLYHLLWIDGCLQGPLLLPQDCYNWALALEWWWAVGSLPLSAKIQPPTLVGHSGQSWSSIAWDCDWGNLRNVDLTAFGAQGNELSSDSKPYWLLHVTHVQSDIHTSHCGLKQSDWGCSLCHPWIYWQLA